MNIIILYFIQGWSFTFFPDAMSASNLLIKLFSLLVSNIYIYIYREENNKKEGGNQREGERNRRKNRNLEGKRKGEEGNSTTNLNSS